jgi:hypothetical protein
VQNSVIQDSLFHSHEFYFQAFQEHEKWQTQTPQYLNLATGASKSVRAPARKSYFHGLDLTLGIIIIHIRFYMLQDLEDRRNRRAPNRQGLWPCLNLGHWCVAVDQIAVRVVLDHEFARVEPVVELEMQVSG